MRRVIVQYKVKPDAAAENERLIEAVFDQLKQEKPRGLRYASFKAKDGVSFTHVASIEDGANPLAQLEAFKRFSSTIGERCVAPPLTTELELVGDYGAFE